VSPEVNACCGNRERKTCTEFAGDVRGLAHWSGQRKDLVKRLVPRADL